MKKILIVDDDHDLSSLIKSVLINAGYDVSLANAPQACIDIIKKEKPDLVLMDVILPGMNGAEIVKALKEEPLIRDIPVIFLTGLLSNQERYNKAGGIFVDGNHYRAIAKPFTTKDLLKEIKGILG